MTLTRCCANPVRLAQHRNVRRFVKGAGVTRNSMIAAAAGTLGGVLLVAAWQQSLLGVMLGLIFSPLPLAMTALGLGLTYLPVAVMGGAVAVMVLTGSF